MVERKMVQVTPLTKTPASSP